LLTLFHTHAHATGQVTVERVPLVDVPGGTTAQLGDSCMVNMKVGAAHTHTHAFDGPTRRTHGRAWLGG
jgi:hypothetical protein